MSSIFHALNIGTLANWLSVLVFGTVAVAVPDWHPAPPLAKEAETRVVTEEFTLGDTSESETQESTELPPEIQASTMEAVPMPPELPSIAEFAPLPEIPDLPAPGPATPQPAEAPPTRPTGKTTASRPTTSTRPSNASRPATTGRSGGGTSGNPSPGLSNSARLAAGRMPPPSYPPYSRRNNQTGTVVVEFTVDSNGKVISAHAKSPSPWPLLNNEAVRTVRRWKFPPGGVMKLQRPIVFKLR